MNGITQMVIIAVSTLVLMMLDPLGLNVSDTSARPALYFILPALVVWYFFAKPYYQRKNLTDEQKQQILIEKVMSVLRSVIKGVGLIIAFSAAINFEIPYIGAIQGALQYIADNFDVAVNAIQALLGFGISIYGFFIERKRFESRAFSHESRRLK